MSVCFAHPETHPVRDLFSSWTPVGSSHFHCQLDAHTGLYVQLEEDWISIQRLDALKPRQLGSVQGLHHIERFCAMVDAIKNHKEGEELVVRNKGEVIIRCVEEANHICFLYEDRWDNLTVSYHDWTSMKRDLASRFIDAHKSWRTRHFTPYEKQA